jgi:xanthine dehydrogenase accessory factor
MIKFYEKLSELLSTGEPFVSVTIVDAQGSIPQNVGAKMLVTAEGLYYGTVGGGKIEMRAIASAQELLLKECAGTLTQLVTWSLSKDIGMTCGGSVKLYFERFSLSSWKIVVFGAGHCSNALINILVSLDCQIICIDPRQEWLSKLPSSPRLKLLQIDDMPSCVSSLADNSFVLLMTMGHGSDKPILLEIFKQGKKFPYLGVIGSESKAAYLKKDIVEAGLPADLQDAFYCPVGLDLGGNHPQEIAVSIAAQLIQQRDRLVKIVQEERRLDIGVMV